MIGKKRAARHGAGKGLIEGWWWFNSANAAEKCEAALAWETIRRTRSYRALWRMFKNQTVPLLGHQGTPTLAGAFQHMHLFQRAREALGQPYFDFMMKGFDPDLTWLELDERQRLTARGFIVANGEALKVNPEYLLPRQMADERPEVSLGMVELDRDGSGCLCLKREVRFGFALRKIAHTDFFRNLGLRAPGRYLLVYFDTRGARDALLHSFDAEMLRWLGTNLPASGKEIDGGYWAQVSRTTARFEILWNAENRSPLDYWVPEFGEASVRARRDEVAVVPSEMPAFAIFMISARHNPATVRASFHTHLKGPQFKRWHPPCVDFWRTLTVETRRFPRNPDGTKRIELDERGHPIRQKVLRHLFDPKEHLPSVEKPTRSARRKDLWLGLAANDVLTSGLPLGKGNAAGALLLEHSPSCDALRNAQRSAARRLGELDKAAGRLDKNLSHWNDQSTILQKAGFFQAAAGEGTKGCP